MVQVKNVNLPEGCLLLAALNTITEFKTEKLTGDIFRPLGWTIIEGPEYDPFSENGKIEGREIETIC